MKSLTFLLLSILLYTNSTFAQTIKTTNGIDQSCFTLSNDMKCYEVIYKEHGKEYLSYYQLIREKIIQRLKCNYINNYQDGEIILFFVLNAKGSLARIDVDTGRSTKSKELINIALLSLQEASPFPPFPKGLDISELPFTVTVSFKENRDW